MSDSIRRACRNRLAVCTFVPTLSVPITTMRKAGVIVLPDGQVSMTCLIHEMSNTGAHLKVAWPHEVPLHFTFMASDHVHREASVLWWDIDAVGVRFREGPPQVSKEAIRPRHKLGVKAADLGDPISPRPRSG
jgi:hypothetical protein